MDDFPSNSQRSKEERIQPKPTGKKVAETKKIEQIVSGGVVRRKQSLLKRVRNDARGVSDYIFRDVLIPAAKNMVTDSVQQGIERMIFPDSRPRSHQSRGGNNGYVSYNRVGSNSGSWNNRQEQRRDVSRRARSTHDFDEIILESRGEAEEVLDALYELLSKYDSASVSALYELTGISGNYTDDKWGWTSLQGASVSHVRNGYLINLPKPEPLD